MKAVIKVDAGGRKGMALLMYLPNYVLTRKNMQK